MERTIRSTHFISSTNNIIITFRENKYFNFNYLYILANVPVCCNGRKKLSNNNEKCEQECLIFIYFNFLL